jgi:carbon-monoxide dehydrogenase small subunit
MKVTFRLNGVDTAVEVARPVSLLDVLRDQLELFGSKNACEQGECGSCSVTLDGELVCSCLVLGTDAEGSEVTTVEGLSSDEALHPVQEAINRAGAVQCGFCTPGIVVAAVDLFQRNPHPSRFEIKEALAGNICRCTGYGAIVRAFEDLAAGAGS